MVERPLHSVEWSEPDSSQLLPHHRDRCLEKAVGGSVLEWWKDHFTQWNGRSLIAHNSSLTIERRHEKRVGGSVR